MNGRAGPTDRQKARTDDLLADPANKPLALAHGACQKIISCHAHEDRRKGRGMMVELIESLAVKGGAPGCPELATLGRTLKRRMGYVLAFFDHPQRRERADRGHQRKARDPQGHSPWDSATLTTTSPEACSTPEALDTPSKPTSNHTTCTPKCEEPATSRRPRPTSARASSRKPVPQWSRLRPRCCSWHLPESPFAGPSQDNR